MKSSTILKTAKRFIRKNGNNRYFGVCSAILHASYSLGNASFDKAGELEEEISRRVQPVAYAHTWLASHVLYGGIKRFSNRRQEEIRQWLYAQGDAAIQQWRLRWLDQLIAEYKAKGD